MATGQRSPALLCRRARTFAVAGLVIAAATLWSTAGAQASGNVSKCDSALIDECNAERLRGLLMCGKCAGVRQAELERAGCNRTQVSLLLVSYADPYGEALSIYMYLSAESH